MPLGVNIQIINRFREAGFRRGIDSGNRVSVFVKNTRYLAKRTCYMNCAQRFCGTSDHVMRAGGPVCEIDKNGLMIHNIVIALINTSVIGIAVFEGKDPIFFFGLG